MSSMSPDVPALVPARMLNEVLYGERLMYLEWVIGDNYSCRSRCLTR